MILLRLPKDVQKYVLSFVSNSRDSSVKQKYIDNDFKNFLTLINHRITVNKYFTNMCNFINIDKEELWKIWNVQYPSLYLYYWEEIMVRNNIFFNLKFSDIKYSFLNNINWMKLT